ncbi:MAG: hypothetical protein R3A11_02615 [Bdellovibrionota bacterium]
MPESTYIADQDFSSFEQAWSCFQKISSAIDSTALIEMISARISTQNTSTLSELNQHWIRSFGYHHRYSTNQEQSIRDLKTKLHDLTKQKIPFVVAPQSTGSKDQIQLIFDGKNLQIHLPFADRMENVLRFIGCFSKPFATHLQLKSSQVYSMFEDFSLHCQDGHHQHQDFSLRHSRWFQKQTFPYLIRAVETQVGRHTLISEFLILATHENYVSDLLDLYQLICTHTQRQFDHMYLQYFATRPLPHDKHSFETTTELECTFEEFVGFGDRFASDLVDAFLVFDQLLPHSVDSKKAINKVTYILRGSGSGQFELRLIVACEAGPENDIDHSQFLFRPEVSSIMTFSQL